MSIFSLFLTVSAFIFLPFFAYPNNLLNRNNDLTETFWPYFYFIKQNILVNHRIPMVNEVYFAGAPLLPDPQNPIWYLPNTIFLLFDIDKAILISLFLHTVFGFLGMYFAAKIVFGFSKHTSFTLSLLFVCSSQFFSYLEAGHWGLAIAWSWLPYLLLSAHGVFHKPTWKIISLFAISASSIYFNHILIFGIALLSVVAYWLYKKSFKLPLVALAITFILISPAAIPQIKWQSKTTRSLLLRYPETFPVWRGKREFIRTIFLFNPETEKAITVGFFPTILALIGLSKIKRLNRICVFSFFLLISLIVLNNVSPLYNLLLKIDFFVLMRVSTRIWFLAYLMILFLIGLAIEKGNKLIMLVLGTFAIAESIIIGYSYFGKPISSPEKVPDEIYHILDIDKSNFRVLCLNRCFSQKEAAIRNLKLVEGYGILQTLDYFYGIQKALNYSWDKYTHVIPPFDIYLYQEIQPNAHELTKFNTKYIISKHLLSDKNFLLINKFQNYYIYVNTLWQ